MPFCPSCRAEYREGITRCASCDVDLVDSLPEEVEDTTTLATLATFDTVAEAEMVQEILEKNDIPTVLRGQTDPIGVASGAERTELQVAENDLERAQELYHSFYRSE